MKRSKRFEALEARPVNQDGFVEEWPEVGLMAMGSPNDPIPSIKIENGKIVEMDGVPRSKFDFIEQFIADYAIDVKVAEKAMATDPAVIAKMLVDVNVSRQEVRSRNEEFAHIHQVYQWYHRKRQCFGFFPLV